MLEQELKLTAVDEEVLSKVLQSELIRNHCTMELPKPKRFLAHYYDTKKIIFERNGCSLRARQEGEYFRAAFKQRGKIVDGMSQRHEFECDVDGWLKNAGMLPDGDVKSLVLNLVDETEPLITKVIVDMQRCIADLVINGTQIELVTDEATIKGVSQSVNLYEVELELKSGDINEVHKLGELLKLGFELVPSELTKHQIGLSLN